MHDGQRVVPRQSFLVIVSIGICIWFSCIADISYANDTPVSGKQLFETRQFDAARQFFEFLVATSPTNAIGFFYLGRIAFEEKHYQQAVERFEQAVLLDHTNSNYHLWLGRAYGYLARESSILWQLPRALKVKEHFEKAVDLDPDNLDARADLMEYYLKAPRLLGGGKEKAEQQAHEISERDLQEGMRAWRMITAEEAHERMQTTAEKLQAAP